VDDWAALLAMVGTKVREPDTRMSVVFCVHGKERFGAFLASREPFIWAFIKFCDDNDIDLMSEDKYASLLPFPGEEPLVHAPLNSATAVKVAANELTTVQGKTTNDFNIAQTEEPGKAILAALAEVRGYSSAETGLKFSTNEMCDDTPIGRSLRKAFAYKQIGQSVGVKFIEELLKKMPSMMDAFYTPAVQPTVKGNAMTDAEIALYTSIIEGLRIDASEGGKGNNLKPWLTAMVKSGITWEELEAYRFPSLVPVVTNIMQRLGKDESSGVLLFINVVVKMTHMMYGDEFVQYVFNTGEMKDWIAVGPQIPPSPANATLVEVFLQDTPPLWDLMAFARTLAGDEIPASFARHLVQRGVFQLNYELLSREEVDEQLRKAVADYPL